MSQPGSAGRTGTCRNYSPATTSGIGAGNAAAQQFLLLLRHCAVALSYDPKINYYMEQISLPVAGEADNLSRANLLGELYHFWQRKKQLSLELSAYANSFKKQACETAREINCFLANL